MGEKNKDKNKNKNKELNKTLSYNRECTSERFLFAKSAQKGRNRGTWNPRHTRPHRPLPAITARRLRFPVRRLDEIMSFLISNEEGVGVLGRRMIRKKKKKERTRGCAGWCKRWSWMACGIAEEKGGGVFSRIFGPGRFFGKTILGENGNSLTYQRNCGNISMVFFFLLLVPAVITVWSYT